MKKIHLWENPPRLRLILASRHPARTLGTTNAYRWHRHPFYELGIVLRGDCDWRIGQRRLLLRTGEAVLLRPGHLHREEPRPGCAAELAWLGFDFSGAPPRWSESVISLGEEFQEISTTFQAAHREHSALDARTRLRVRLAIQNILLLVSRRAEKEGPAFPSRPMHGSPLNARQIRCVEAAAHYFRENLQQPLSIAQVAAYHSLCPAYFSTLFRRYFQLSPRPYLQAMRLERAKQLLADPEVTLKEISAACGFVDASHFSKMFTRRRGISPGAFRRSLGQR